MNFLHAFIKKEWHDFQSLSPQGRRLLFAFFFMTIAFPMITTFTNTYLWRQSHDVVLVVLYNIAFCAVILWDFLSMGYS
ncbi:hypothetical protein FJZ48_00605 [Candidatus Uhrbacteria bacterium]|nr:hypothetical protein [Candidatus Uhrbacteria bacterium]